MSKHDRPKPACNSVISIARYGGARRDRTDDLMLAKHPLYQLSYGPLSLAHVGNPSGSRRHGYSREMVGPGRLELPTLRLSGVRSNHLSYRPPEPQKGLGTSSKAAHATPGSRSHRQPIRTPIQDPPAGDEWKEKRRRRRSAPI